VIFAWKSALNFLFKSKVPALSLEKIKAQVKADLQSEMIRKKRTGRRDYVVPILFFVSTKEGAKKTYVVIKKAPMKFKKNCKKTGEKRP